MKFFWMALSGLLFGLVVLVVSLFRQTHLATPHAYDRFSGGIEYSTQSATPLAYRLPYPGLLPDNPLYFIKMIRDRVRLLATPQEARRVRLLIDYGDKRVGAAYYLAYGNKIPLAYTTALKSFSYMDQAVTALTMYELTDIERNDLTHRLSLSLATHIKTLGEVVLMVEGDARVQFDRVMDAYKALEMSVSGKLSTQQNELEVPTSSNSGELEGYL